MLNFKPPCLFDCEDPATGCSFFVCSCFCVPSCATVAMWHFSSPHFSNIPS